MRSPVVIVVSNAQDPTVPLVEPHLERAGVGCVRLNTEALGEAFSIEYHIRDRVPRPVVELPDGPLAAEDVLAVWYRRPLPPPPPAVVAPGQASEFAAAELRSLLDGALECLDCLWVSRPHAIRRATLKLWQLQVASRLGFSLPRTLVSRDPARIRAFCECLWAGGSRVAVKCIAKGPPQAATLDEQYMLYTTIVEPDETIDDSALAACPALYQEYVEKRAELRVTVVGSRVFACAIHSQASERTRIDWRRYDLDNTPHEAVTLDAATERRCAQMTASLGLEFSAIDLVVRPDGEIVFLEMNPNGQWGWIEELTGLPIAGAIAEHLARGARS